MRNIIIENNINVNTIRDNRDNIERNDERIASSPPISDFL